MIIISASRRTDVPAWHSDWFMAQVRAGFCLVPNPYNPKLVAQVSLKPEDVDAIVFWSKNPAPMAPRLDVLSGRGYRFYFQFTLNDYPVALEPHMPPIEKRLETFKLLSGKIGAERVIWRYDPIIASNRTDYDWHRRIFANLCRELSPHTRRVVISIVDYYAKTKKAFALLEESGFGFPPDPVDAPEMQALLRDIADTARAAGLEVQSCAEKRDLRSLGIAPGKCIDGDLIERLWPMDKRWKKDPYQRKTCGCVVSKDIGVNGTCSHGCVYCYAATVSPPSTLSQSSGSLRPSVNAR